ncbi:MAG: hypothetical protein ACTSQJ_18575 [Promethearchaeota archaeon]
MPKIIIDEKLLSMIFEQEARVLVGKVCKRFEVHSELKEIKAAVKELLYETMRDTHRMIVYNGKEPVHLTNKKQGEKYG